ncbi:MAG: peroxiredoxin [Proteobacteria bacterium]|nr:peroxiredoxin [Pseudomonadota bacterium]
MVGDKFPANLMSAVDANGIINEEFDITKFAKGEKVVVFFYPLDFTFVCPTEIVAFNKAVEEFAKRGCKLVGVSVDSVYSHNAWRNTALNDGGIGKVDFPLVSDMERTWSDQLGILAEGSVTYRASYLIDEKGTIRHMVINDLPLGRSVSEMLRMVDALNFHEKHGDVCPANWKDGDEAISADKESTAAYLAKQ